ncbi:MAG TPA: sugar-binding transcriptional regulator [Firmicutes bacterium]|nr:sugar-binding transcriptional regulator [Bacillota bacterium]
MGYFHELELALLAAELYYRQNKTQQEIAGQLKLSRIKVQRLLQKAREAGLVKIEIVSPFPACDALATRLCKEFGLKEAIIVPIQSDSQTVIREVLGSVAAEYVGKKIADGQVIGLGWGRTIYEVVRFWNPQLKARVQVVPLFGGFGQTEPWYQANEMARRVAEALGGESHPLYAPIIVDDVKIRDALLSDRTIGHVYRLWDKVDLAIVGIGSSLDTVTGQLNDYVSQNERQEVEAKGVIGDIALYFFDSAGRIVNVSLNDRLVGIRFDQLKRISLVVGVAGGEEKVKTIAGALRTGLLDVIVSDRKTIEVVMGS